MSMTRTGHRPQDWRDDGPQSATMHTHAFVVHADNVGQMRPILREGISAFQWKGQRKAHSITGKPKP